MPSALERLIPGLSESRAVEHLNRALDFAGLPRAVAGEVIRPTTTRMKLELQLLQNAFAAGLAPLRGDVSEFLWVHSPKRCQGVRGLLLQRLAARRLRRRSHVDNVREIRLHLLDELQDMPGSSVGGESSDFSPWIHWCAGDAGFWINVHGGFTLAEYLDTPILVLQQLFRVWQINHPETIRGRDGYPVPVEPSFSNASDRIRERWLGERKAAAAEMIKAQRFVIP